MTDVKKVFQTRDGKSFDSLADAQNYLRRPKIIAVLMKLTNGNKELSDWLVDNQETVLDAFNSGIIRRVTKSEKNKLIKALDAIKASGEDKFKFVVENAAVIVETFKWPKVKKMSDEEKHSLAVNTLMKASNNNQELTDWVIKNEDSILAAYEAGKEKREVSPKAEAGLAAYRKGKEAEKAALAEGKTQEEAEAIGKQVIAEARTEMQLAAQG